MEDYALHFTYSSFAKWANGDVANTAGQPRFFYDPGGGPGTTFTGEIRLHNAFWAILATGLIIFT
jgi:hypothetical protein